MIGTVIYYVIYGSYGNYDFDTGKMIWDKDPRFVLQYFQYVQHFHNTIRRELMRFGAPLFCVIVTGIVLTRDWRDNFFEIEHAGDVRPSKYFLGRFLAVFSFLTVSALIVYLLAFHSYIISRGGVPDLSPWEYFIDSNVRLLRVFFITGIPGILVFSGITFLVGNLTKSGTFGTIAGLVYVLFEYLMKTVLTARIPQIYFNYMTPTPSYLYQYWAYYDTEWFEIKFPHNPFTTGQMLLCLGILYSAAVVFAVGSYVCVRKRKV